MNLYDLHSRPETLKGWEQRFEIPPIAYDEAKKKFNETGKRDRKLEQVLAKHPKYSFAYAFHVLQGRFPEGEPTIATVPQLAYEYAWYVYVLGSVYRTKRFPLGEPAIARSAQYSWKYAYYILEDRFLLGEPAIAKNKKYKKSYEKHFKVKL